MTTIEFVSATRASAEHFPRTALGFTLARFEEDQRFSARITMENRAPLPSVYNHAIAETAADILVFVHDDVFLEDLFLFERLVEALGQFDVVGICGNRRPRAGLLMWYDDDRQFLSGTVAQGSAPLGAINYFGPAPRACELLDGLFLAVEVGRLRASGVLFDEQFTFDFYDLDFCRTARKAGLRLGTWPISLTHQSGGAGAGGERWTRLSQLYLAKWPA